MDNKKVNIFIVGAAKSGTSSIIKYMHQHREIFVPAIKEPSFFMENYGINSESEYQRLFSQQSIKQLGVDASTGYLFDSKSASRIYKYNPDAKIVICLRNPIDAAFSFWRFNNVAGNEVDIFEDAFFCRVLARAANLAGENGWKYNYMYNERVRYHNQLKRYFDIFGRKNVFVLPFEKFIKDQLLCLSAVENFLQIENVKYKKIQPKNMSGEVRSKMIKNLRGKSYPFLKKITPIGIRHKIRNLARDLNTKPNKETLNVTLRAEIAKELACDVKKLNLLLNDNLWEDDFPKD